MKDAPTALAASPSASVPTATVVLEEPLGEEPPAVGSTYRDAEVGAEISDIDHRLNQLQDFLRQAKLDSTTTSSSTNAMTSA